jgi:gamma-glutamyl:cysteine ligase YbdK (ATP-grasp superfamily)
VPESRPLHLFEGFGIELEYMICDRRTLAVMPLSDRLIHSVAGAYESEVELGDIAWSNELVLHVIELKTNGPRSTLEGAAVRFLENVRRINAILQPMDAMLVGSAMHPFMDPMREMRLWPHEYNAVYAAFDRIFDCKGHGWANLLSMHVNLPFTGDEELGLLHSAIRLLLPILPAIAASSPIVDGKTTGYCDSRLQVYRSNSAKIPSITGRVIPEPVYTRAAYEEQILQRIYRDLAPYDPEGVLQDEFANARGAIVRFDRSAIEIRVIDVQETPRADLAIAAASATVLRWMISSGIAERAKTVEVDPLAAILDATIKDADRASIEDDRYLSLLSVQGPIAAGDLWRALVDRAGSIPLDLAGALDFILRYGPLARRILARTGDSPSREVIDQTYEELAACLEEDRLFAS